MKRRITVIIEYDFIKVDMWLGEKMDGIKRAIEHNVPNVKVIDLRDEPIHPEE